METDIMRVVIGEYDDDDYLFFHEAINHFPIPVVYRFKNGIEFMDFLSEGHKIDIIFIDFNIHQKNAYDCLSKIRSDENLKILPIVILSTSSSSDVISYMYNSGADAFIIKPNSFKKWKAVIGEALKCNWVTRRENLDIKTFVISANNMNDPQ